MWGGGNTPTVDHVALADWADLLVVAPATAHTIAKLANGLADDFLSTYFLAHRKAVLLAPAMESAMWDNPAVAANRAALVSRGVEVVGPATGPLRPATGPGRMAEPGEIVEAAANGSRIPRPRPAGSGECRADRGASVRLSNRAALGYALAEAPAAARRHAPLSPTGLARPKACAFSRSRPPPSCILSFSGVSRLRRLAMAAVAVSSRNRRVSVSTGKTATRAFC